MSQQVAHSFGPNMPSRIAGSAQLLLEPGEVAPVPMYQPLVPFLGSQVVSGAASSSSVADTDPDEWKAYPGRLDLFWYQGDDVQIPLFFQDPSDWEIDMSTAAGWEWRSQLRILHSTRSTLVTEFSCAAEYVPPVPADEQPQGFTKVTLFLPRILNTYAGVYRWDVQSLGPFSGPTFPIPEGVDPEDWPPDDQIKTWLYGAATIVPRVTATDVLPTIASGSVYPGGTVMMTPAGWTVGPNGRVP